MRVILPDSSELELPDGATGLDAARAIGPKLAEQAVLVRSNGAVRDVRLPLQDGERIQILTTRDKDDPDALAVLRHSSAHLLAEAVRRLYPGVKIAIGPPIENGFYYDFEFPEPIGEGDLERIEAEIRRELEEGRSWERQEVSRDEAKRYFAEQGEEYKVELVDAADGEITFYDQDGQFTDLCRGPHLQDSRPIKAIKLTGLAGAYWRGDERNKQLTRIYGTAFYAREDLERHLRRLDEAKRRDHRRIGPQLDLFHFEDVAPGMPLWHPKGMALWHALEDLRRAENARRGYLEVRTPLMWDTEVWKRSGHWEKYRDALFLVPHGETTFGLKPMNCPGHMLLFASRLRSYRELPLRYAEAASLHRDEPTGTLHGLLRVRQLTQDDAHVFCTEEQVQDEIDAMFDYVGFLYDRFGVRELAHAELATRPENKLGSDEQWDHTEGLLRTALERQGIPYRVMEGEGAFYGPKIDLFMDDAMGRPWQMGTIQLDGQQPARLGCAYVGPDNREHTPYVIHRALFGSLERFLGILIEHYGGAFPLWLAPVQVRVIPVGSEHREPAAAIVRELGEHGFRADVDDRDETVGKRIRDAELEKVPKVVVYGDRESRETLAVRDRGGERSTQSVDDLLAELRAAGTRA
ncbi:MAG: threonine--tRNA ligase [Thermoleophilia bacterium]|nr:threonine--tRNA ligase [Thermoleophilia bacterium]